jgi:RimJ/RimL family protein N-acetyltransferase
MERAANVRTPPRYGYRRSRSSTLFASTIVIRPLAPEDRQEFSVARDLLIWAQHPTEDRWTRQGFDAFFDQSIASGGALVIHERAGSGLGRIVGSSRYNGYDPTTSTVEIGWTFLARDHWGKQTNSEVKRLMLAHAHGFARRLVLIVDDKNTRSQRAVEKIGGQAVGTREEPSGRISIIFAVDAPTTAVC